MTWLYRLFTFSDKTNIFYLNSIRLGFLLTPLLLCFQNCANDVQFSKAPETVSAASIIPPSHESSFMTTLFSFLNQTGASPGASIISNAVILSGAGSSPVSAYCNGCLVQKNGVGPFVKTLPEVKGGDSVVVQMTAASTYAASVKSSLQVGSVSTGLWTVTTKTAPTGGSCSANQGQACDNGTEQLVSGCPANYLCAAFVGIYYNSPGGCDRSPGSSWLEYSFDGATEWFRGSNNPEGSRLGDYSSAYHCTYVGNGSYDPFHNVPNGTCFNSSAAGYSSDNTWTKVVRGEGCVTSQHNVVPGKIQCDGSCK